MNQFQIFQFIKIKSKSKKKSINQQNNINKKQKQKTKKQKQKNKAQKSTIYSLMLNELGALCFLVGKWVETVVRRFVAKDLALESGLIARPIAASQPAKIVEQNR